MIEYKIQVVETTRLWRRMMKIIGSQFCDYQLTMDFGGYPSASVLTI
jgi:hypothetical protein